MIQDKVYSNRLLKGIVDFIEARFGKVITDEVLARVGLDRLQLNVMSGFATMEVCHSLVTTAIELTGDKQIPYFAGRDLPNSMGKVGGFIMGITSPSMFMKCMSGIESRVALKTINQTTRIGKGRYRIEITFKDGFREKPYVCENRIGCYESSPLFFGLPYAKVGHPQCLHRGEGNCVYIMEWPEHRFLALKRLAVILGLAGLAALGWALTAAPPASVFLLPSLVSLASLLSFSQYSRLSAKHSLEWSMLINEGLVKQNDELEKLNEKIATFHNLSAELVNCTDLRDVFGKVTGYLVTQMGFGSCQLWRVDESGGNLYCASARGLDERASNALSEARFAVAMNAENSHGLFAQALDQRRTIVADDMQAVLPRISALADAHIRRLGYTAIIITPLFDGRRPLGLLVGGYHMGEAIGTQDRALFQSLAHTIVALILRSKYGTGLEPPPGG